MHFSNNTKTINHRESLSSREAAFEDVGLEKDDIPACWLTKTPDFVRWNELGGRPERPCERGVDEEVKGLENEENDVIMAISERFFPDAFCWEIRLFLMNAKFDGEPEAVKFDEGTEEPNKWGREGEDNEEDPIGKEDKVDADAPFDEFIFIGNDSNWCFGNMGDTEL